MKHKHHIIPKHMGGSDDPSNIVELTVKEHSEAHLKLYEQYGKKEDLCAYYMLSGKSQDPEFKKMISSLGGEGSYEKRKEKGIGHLAFFGAGLTNEEKFKICSKGGKTQGRRNAESGHLRRIAQIPSKKNRGMFWITNGKESKMINPTDNVPEGFRKGRKIKSGI